LAGGQKLRGKCSAIITGSDIVVSTENGQVLSGSAFDFQAADAAEGSFTLYDVTIGINFHWERKEDQVFRGSLKFICRNGLLQAINVLPVEDYLVSVISSEMSATASLEFLKAHAVISRGWLLAQIEKSRSLRNSGSGYSPSSVTGDEIIRWYDREDHEDFDVCADDHCQRYQGITRALAQKVSSVISETEGQVLVYNGGICDTRFYKCCGGVTEIFENTWEPVNHPYLQRVTDTPEPTAEFKTDLTDEAKARAFIDAAPDAFCNTSDRSILTQVLNDYDQETNDFFRWKVTYTAEELSSLVKLRTGIDFGTITELIPVERGLSGRIIKLRIAGTAKTMVLGKELEIRKALSKSHLYSSCFYTEKKSLNESTIFILHGAGWGHGVGLCQIGAAVMGDKGYTYRQILGHYFPGSEIEKRY
jgi:SpoIID/LytB domain protein